MNTNENAARTSSGQGSSDMPEMRCPRCGAEHPDFDGFGFVAHTKPAYADGCGWRSHPTRDGDTCSICGDIRSEVA